MPQSFSKVYLHYVFSTKYRQKRIPESLRKNLQAYINKVLNNHGSFVKEIYANPDHVHILCSLPRTVTISKLAQEVKASSSRWLKKEGVTNFQWQNGYGVFSESHFDLEKIARYIRNQKEHHQKKNYKEEYKKILRDHQVSFDEDNIWD